VAPGRLKPDRVVTPVGERWPENTSSKTANDNRASTRGALPARVWKFYEWIIRHAAGSGRAPKTDDSAHYKHHYLNADIAIVQHAPDGAHRRLL